jgi:hypothetical protein
MNGIQPISPFLQLFTLFIIGLGGSIFFLTLSDILRMSIDVLIKHPVRSIDWAENGKVGFICALVAAIVSMFFI